MSCRLQIAFGHYSDGARCRDHIRKRRSPLSTSPYNYCTFKQIHNSTACRDVEWDNVEDHVAFFFLFEFFGVWWWRCSKINHQGKVSYWVLLLRRASWACTMRPQSGPKRNLINDECTMCISHLIHTINFNVNQNWTRKNDKKKHYKNIQKYRCCEYCMPLCEGVCMCVLYVPVIYAKLFIFAVCVVLCLFVVRVCVGFSFKNIIFNHSSFLSLSFFAQIQTHTHK